MKFRSTDLPTFLMLLAATPPGSIQAQISADSGARLLESGRKALAGQTRVSLSSALELGRQAAIWSRSARRPSDEAEARRQIGLAHLRLGTSDSALAQLTRAQELARPDTAGLVQIDIANALGEAYEQTSKYGQALDRYREAYKLSTLKDASVPAAQSLNNIGLVHYYLGNVDSSGAILTKAYKAAEAVHDTMLMGTALGNLGAVIEEVRGPDSALTLYRKSMALSRRANDMKNVASNEGNIGLTHHNQGRVDSARVYYQRALATLEQAEVEAPVSKRILANNLGALERALGRPAAALDYYRKALNDARAIGDGGAVASIQSNIGVVYIDLERLDSAAANFRSAIDTFRLVDSPWPLRSALHNLGSVYDGLGMPDSAELYYRAALKLSQELKDSAAQAMAFAGLALVHRARGQVDTALAYARQGYELGLRTRPRDVAVDLTNIGALHEQAGRLDSAAAYYLRAIRAAKKLKSPQTQWSASGNLGMLYHHSPKPDLPRALAHYDSTSVLVGALRNEAGSDINRLTFFDVTKELFGLWALAWLDRKDVPARERGFAALAAAERGRAQVLLDLVRGTDSSARAGRNLAREGMALVRKLPSPVLSYYVTKDTLLIWLTKGPDILVSRQPISRDTLAERVARLSTSLRDTVPGWRDRAGELSQVLLPSELAGQLPEQGELVIVPHGPLALVPFGVLTPGQDTEPLGAKRAIRYVPSLEILRRVAARRDRRAAIGREPSLVLGNPTMPEYVDPAGIDINLSPLPHTEAEASAIAGRLGTTALVGDNASEAEVRRRIPGAAVVHLATHGYAYSSEARTRESFAALAPGDEGDVHYDGHLTVAEVLDELPPLTAELVALSACESGLGNLKQTEGTIGLQRAFLARGARSVLVSLWSVPDDATSMLMQRFYAHWLGADHPSKAEALRRAQAEVRAEHPHPWFWAAFQLVGAQ